MDDDLSSYCSPDESSASSTDNDDSASSADEETIILPKNYADKWYYHGPNKQSRRRYLFCGDCDFKSYRHYRLEHHMKLVHSSNSTHISAPKKILDELSCPYCDYRANIAENLHRHELHHQKKSVHQCPQCSYSVRTEKRLDHHLKHHHTQLTPQSDGVKSKSEEWYYAPCGKRYRYLHCADCEFKTTIIKNMTSHIKTFHPFSTLPSPQKSVSSSKKPRPKYVPGEMKYHCTECKFITDRKKLFEHHKSLHRTKSEFQCPKCSYSINTSGNLNRHIKMHHEMPSKKKARTKTESNLKNGLVFKCKHCEFYTDRTKSWMSHVENHRENYEFKCSKCTYSSKLQLGLTHHLKHHHPNNESPNKTLYQCPLCEFNTPYPESIERHENGHQRGGKFKCLHCSFASDFQRITLIHMKCYHKRPGTSLKVAQLEVLEEDDDGDAPRKQLYECQDCDYSTDYPNNFKKHLVGHQRNEKYKCGLCNYSSNDKPVVTRHLDKQHRNKEKIGPTGEIKIGIGDEKASNLRIRVKFMTDRVVKRDQELQDVLLKQEIFDEKMRELVKRKESALQTQRRELINIFLVNSDQDLNLVKAKLKVLEEELKGLDNELSTLREEESNLLEDVKEAQESLLGATQVLEALKHELNDLESTSTIYDQ